VAVGHLTDLSDCSWAFASLHGCPISSFADMFQQTLIILTFNTMGNYLPFATTDYLSNLCSSVCYIVTCMQTAGTEKCNAEVLIEGYTEHSIHSVYHTNLPPSRTFFKM
jgi:hypothetical protein